MTTVEEVKKAGPERHLTNKYNFAGKLSFSHDENFYEGSYQDQELI